LIGGWPLDGQIADPTWLEVHIHDPFGDDKSARLKYRHS
jgi:hypothetical protein